MLISIRSWKALCNPVVFTAIFPLLLVLSYASRSRSGSLAPTSGSSSAKVYKSLFQADVDLVQYTSFPVKSS